MEKTKALAMGQLFKSGDSMYVVEAVPGNGRSSYQFHCLESGWCLDVEPEDIVRLEQKPHPAVYWRAAQNGHFKQAPAPTNNERVLLLTLAEMENAKFSTLEEALLLFSRREIFDAWLRYTGIQGYTSSILSALQTLGYDLGIDDPDFFEDIQE